jgi:hypothetical protein
LVRYAKQPRPHDPFHRPLPHPPIQRVQRRSIGPEQKSCLRDPRCNARNPRTSPAGSSHNKPPHPTGHRESSAIVPNFRSPQSSLRQTRGSVPAPTDIRPAAAHPIAPLPRTPDRAPLPPLAECNTPPPIPDRLRAAIRRNNGAWYCAGCCAIASTRSLRSAIPCPVDSAIFPAQSLHRREVYPRFSAASAMLNCGRSAG